MALRLALLSMIVLTLTGCDNTGARFSSDYQEQLSSKEILILPPFAEANVVDAGNGKTRMYDYESYVEPTLANELQKKLSEKGYHARVMHKKDLMANKTYQEYGVFQEAFNTAYKNAYQKGELIKRKEAKNSMITFSGRARELGQKLSAPLLAYIDYNESVRTAGGQAVDFAMAMVIGGGGAPPDNARVVVALIDTESDELVWVNAGKSVGGGVVAGMMYTDQEQSLKHVQNSLNWALRELPDRDKLYEEK